MSSPKTAVLSTPLRSPLLNNVRCDVPNDGIHAHQSTVLFAQHILQNTLIKVRQRLGSGTTPIQPGVKLLLSSIDLGYH